MLHQDHQLMPYMLYENARRSFAEAHTAKICIKTMIQLKLALTKAINASITKYSIQSASYTNFTAQMSKLQINKDSLSQNLLKVTLLKFTDPNLIILETKSKALIDSIEEMSHTKANIMPQNNAIIAQESAISALKKEALIWTPEYMDLIYGPMAPFIRNSIKQENITIIANPGTRSY
jgi:hypothetical protein